MSNMGGSCSLQRQRALWEQQQHHNQQQNSGQRGNGLSANGREGRMGGGLGTSESRRTLRHCVDAEVPDRSISNLYPLSDNYIINPSNNTRSPKSLSSLCIDTVCRSLPDLDGELPPGLPQDIVDAIVRSLVEKAALNATTLRALRWCEIGTLSLAGCRGVRDDWLKPLSSQIVIAEEEKTRSDMDFDFSSAAAAATANANFTAAGGGGNNTCSSSSSPVTRRLMYRGESSGCDSSSSSCSTSSFHSASSTPYAPDALITASSSGSSCPFAAAVGAAATAVGATPSPPPEAATPSAVADSTYHSSLDDIMYDTVDRAPLSQTPSTPPLISSSSSPPFFPQDPYTRSPSPPSITSQITTLDLRGSQRLTDRGLLQLTNLSSLEIAKLDNCHSITGKGLIALSSSTKLHTLSMANCRRLTDEAVVNVCHLTSLTALSLDGCRCLTDRSLESIGQLVMLRQLDLSQCDLITDDGLEHLHDVEYIEELSLGWCRSITNRGIEILSSQPSRAEHLRVLRLARCSITDRGIEHVGKLVNLEELDLNGCSSIGSLALGSTLAKLTNLTSLDVSYCPGIIRSSWQGKIKALKSLELCYAGVRDTHLSRFMDLPALEELNLDSCPVGDWAISHLADNNVVPNLTSLDLADTDLTDLGMVHLPKFENMTRLSLFYCNITSAGLRHLASMTKLEVLNLDSREIGDDGLSYLRGLTRLRSLDIFSGRITDLGCSHLAKIKSLESLELCGGGVGDLGCAHLANLENLTSLNLSQNERITNRGAASLAALSNLKALNLSNTRVDSSALRFLGGLVKLQSLALYGCSGIEDGTSLNTLQSELPSLKCLRLNTSPAEDGTIDPNSGGVEDDDEDDLLTEEAMSHLQRGGDANMFFDDEIAQLRSDASDSVASSRESMLGDPFDEREMDEDNDDSSEGSDSDDSDNDSIRLDEMDMGGEQGGS